MISDHINLQKVSRSKQFCTINLMKIFLGEDPNTPFNLNCFVLNYKHDKPFHIHKSVSLTKLYSVQGPQSPTQGTSRSAKMDPSGNIFVPSFIMIPLYLCSILLNGKALSFHSGTGGFISITLPKKLNKKQNCMQNLLLIRLNRQFLRKYDQNFLFILR